MHVEAIVIKKIIVSSSATKLLIEKQMLVP